KISVRVSIGNSTHKRYFFLGGLPFLLKFLSRQLSTKALWAGFCRTKRKAKTLYLQGVLAFSVHRWTELLVEGTTTYRKTVSKPALLVTP
ncbi:hypothetical protein, partial [Desulfovibrio legallii]|uniref:hypothetical protein n=1 Tax=Desulfovibrio legallii TaxID=571438 RepID=UPI003622CBC7